MDIEATRCQATKSDLLAQYEEYFERELPRRVEQHLETAIFSFEDRVKELVIDMVKLSQKEVSHTFRSRQPTYQSGTDNSSGIFTAASQDSGYSSQATDEGIVDAPRTSTASWENNLFSPGFSLENLFPSDPDPAPISELPYESFLLEDINPLSDTAGTETNELFKT